MADGVERLEHKRWDNGAAYLYSMVGGSLAILCLCPKEDAQGNKIVGSDGFYELTSEPVKVGNTMPKYTGGFGFTVTYQNVYLMFP